MADLCMWGTQDKKSKSFTDVSAAIMFRGCGTSPFPKLRRQNKTTRMD